MVLGRRWLLKRHFDGLPTLEDFELVEEELPALQEDQFVFRSLFIRLALDQGLINIPPPSAVLTRTNGLIVYSEAL